MAFFQLTASTLSACKVDSSLDNRLYSTTKISSVYTPIVNTVNTESERNFLSIGSYNFRGFNFVKSGFINSLLLECDILFIQEHWLSDKQLLDLNKINTQFLSHAVSGFDNSEIISGRPFGGCAILWRSDIRARIEPVNTNSRRICVICMRPDSWSVLFLNVYMPYEDGEERLDDFFSQLSTIEYLICQYPDCHIILGGDFNVDFARNRLHTELLTDFFGNNLCLEPVYRHNKYHIDYSYNFNMSRFNTLDHFIIFGILFENYIMSVDPIHRGDNLSDHEPIVMKLALPAPWQYVYPIHRGDNLSDHEPIVMKLCLDKSSLGFHKKYIVIELHGIKRRSVIL